MNYKPKYVKKINKNFPETIDVLIDDAIKKYHLWSRKMDEFYSINTGYTNSLHGKAPQGNPPVIPPGYALDLDYGRLLSIDVIPVNTWFYYKGRAITGSGKTILLYMYNSENFNWNKVINNFKRQEEGQEKELEKEKKQMEQTEQVEKVEQTEEKKDVQKIKNDGYNYKKQLKKVSQKNQEIDEYVTEIQKGKNMMITLFSGVINFNGFNYFTTNWPECLNFIPDFMKKNEQNYWFNYLNNQSWSQPEITQYTTQPKNRDTLQYGYIYDYKIKDMVGHKLSKIEIPEKIKCLTDLIWKLFGNTEYEPNQIVINRFQTGQGIGPFRDHPLFEDCTIILSLGSNVILNMFKKDNKNEIKINFPLLSGSLLILSGKDKNNWSLEIPNKIEDTYTTYFSGSKEVISWKRTPRISITIRSVKNDYKN